MKITDGTKIVEITMYEGNSPEWSNDFFESGSLEYNEESDLYVVDDVDYCIAQANDWKDGVGDFATDEETNEDLESRAVYVHWIDA